MSPARLMMQRVHATLALRAGAYASATPLLRACLSAAPSPSSRAFSSSGGVSEPPPPLSFIDRAKLFGANSLLGAYINTGSRFDRVLDGMRVVSIDGGGTAGEGGSGGGDVRRGRGAGGGGEGLGVVVAEMQVLAMHANAYGTLHGGCTATLVDVVGTMALLAMDPLRPGVSVDLSCAYVSAAKVGEVVTVTGRVLKTGRTLGFTEVEVRVKSTGKLVATGRHTKAL